ncbi:hypothetical protein CC99x_007825 [Candidatus Berkiella cookevillensis]|uniref:Uncharacterized protein n=2 Tax=Candidatus Berkiella cookevillensis TaxID=437022 RepID=A0AAE3L4G7_9GAMM|nr:hypothetical protein [Candidatus Berkiella cookevillensis]MCS5708811.1 hypothetical protein [Candidatus Berkiella cookevillensis]
MKGFQSLQLVFFFPLHNVLGEKIQHEDHGQQGFIYNLIPLEQESLFIIGFMMSTQNNLHKNFLNPFFEFSKNKNDFLNYILTYILYNNDNIVINPKWYDNLEPAFKDELSQLMNIQTNKYAETITIDYPIQFSTHIKNTSCKILKYHF